jgi:two-component system, sensor histidine kinase and response regulator
MDDRSDEPQTILIVDDVPDNLYLLNKILRDRGYRVQLASNGQQALDSARSDPPDLVLLDVMMPNMDGYQVCERLKADRNTSDIPVLFISALETTEDKLRAFSVGGADYITKPFRSREVLARVNTHLALRRTQRQLQKANGELGRRLAELDEANASLQAQNAELDAFAHTVAHDLKNPVSQVMGFADFLTGYFETLSADELRESLQAIFKASTKMNSIIEELLLLSQVRKVDLSAEVLHMPSIIDEALGRVAQLSEDLGAEIQVPDPASWPAACGHRGWIEEVWVNYLSNALKYGGRPPRVQLGSSIQPDGSVCFWVTDNGGGLTPGEQARLFAPFERIGQVRATGYGLGLSIVRRIVEKLHGRVSVESQLGRGSTFSFTLPAPGCFE